jgi:hypothetical protein
MLVARGSLVMAERERKWLTRGIAVRHTSFQITTGFASAR